METHTNCDWSGIVEVMNRYGAALDTRDWARLRSCFTTDAQLRFPTRTLEGADHIVEQLREAITWVAWQQHHLGSHQVTIDGDTATASCSLLATQFPVDPDAPVRNTIGTYHDQLVRAGGEWKIAVRELRTGGRTSAPA